jgi:hypothetical protein
MNFDFLESHMVTLILLGTAAFLILTLPIVLFLRKKRKLGLTLVSLYLSIYFYMHYFYKNAYFDLEYPENVSINKILINKKKYPVNNNTSIQGGHIFNNMRAVTYKGTNTIDIFFIVDNNIKKEYILSKHFNGTGGHCIGDLKFTVQKIEKIECETIQ